MSTSGDVRALISNAIAAKQQSVADDIRKLGSIGGALDRFAEDGATEWTAVRRTGFPGRLRAALTALGVDVTSIAAWAGELGPETGP